MNTGYIKVFRSIQEWYGISSPTRVSLWINMLLLANHAEKRWLFKGKPYTAKPGQFITSRKSLSVLTGICESTIERHLKEFEDDGQIEQKTSSVNRLITITNYVQRQKGEQPMKQPMKQRMARQSDNTRTTLGQQVDTNKNVKNDKNDKNVIQTVWEYYILKTGKKFKLTTENINLIKNRLKDYTIEQLKTAVDNFVSDDWEGRQSHLDLIYCIGKQKGKPDNCDKWLNYKPKGDNNGSRYRKLEG
jgi:uncharacterized phage protein (TIGR02220 family)